MLRSDRQPACPRRSAIRGHPAMIRPSRCRPCAVGSTRDSGFGLPVFSMVCTARWRCSGQLATVRWICSVECSRAAPASALLRRPSLGEAASLSQSAPPDGGGEQLVGLAMLLDHIDPRRRSAMSASQATHPRPLVAPPDPTGALDLCCAAPPRAHARMREVSSFGLLRRRRPVRDIVLPGWWRLNFADRGHLFGLSAAVPDLAELWWARCQSARLSAE